MTYHHTYYTPVWGFCKYFSQHSFDLLCSSVLPFAKTFLCILSTCSAPLYCLLQRLFSAFFRPVLLLYTAVCKDFSLHSFDLLRSSVLPYVKFRHPASNASQIIAALRLLPPQSYSVLQLKKFYLNCVCVCSKIITLNNLQLKSVTPSGRAKIGIGDIADEGNCNRTPASIWT